MEEIQRKYHKSRWAVQHNYLRTHLFSNTSLGTTKKVGAEYAKNASCLNKCILNGQQWLGITLTVTRKKFIRYRQKNLFSLTPNLSFFLHKTGAYPLRESVILYEIVFCVEYN